MSFPRYPDYKESGVEWLGKVPAHWVVDRIKHSTSSCKNGTWGDDAQQDENDIPCVRVADFDRQQYRVKLIEPTVRNITEREREVRVLRQGDLLLEKSGGGESQPVGAIVLYDDPRPAVCSNFVARIQLAPNMNSSFWRYVHAAAYAVRLNTRSIKQTSGIQNLDDQQYLDEKAGFPPISEQTKIAAFLERETSKIDTLIAEQQRLIELLKEKRQAVISHAVTKGLNPDAPMKDSGIEWLGELPAHWGVRKIRWLFEIKKRIAGELGFDVFSITQQGIRIKDLESNDGQLSMDYSKYQLVEVGDFAMNHMDLLTGGVDIAKARGVTSPDYRVVTIRDQAVCHDKYLLYVFQMCYRNKIFYAYGQGSSQLGRWRFPTEQFKDFFFPLPPKDEQEKISSYLDTELAKLDELSIESDNAIALLQERRSVLISMAVTGKIDVRSFVGKDYS